MFAIFDSENTADIGFTLQVGFRLPGRGVVMLREKPSILPVASAGEPPTLEADGTLSDITLTITALPAGGTVLKSDPITPSVIGGTLTAVALAQLRFVSEFPQSGARAPWSGRVFYPQNCGRLPIPLLVDLPSEQAAADPNLFANSLTNGPLTAPSKREQRQRRLRLWSSSLFPTNSFNSASYGVEVVFTPQLAA